MTRETKVGLVVATSFLGLVGVVVAARISTPEATAKKTPPAEGQTAEKKDKAQKSGPIIDQAKNDNTGAQTVVPANHDEVQIKQPPEPPGAGPLIVDNNKPSPAAESPIPPTSPPPELVGPPPPEPEDSFLKVIEKQTQLVQGPPPPAPKDLSGTGPLSLTPTDLSKTVVPSPVTPSPGPEPLAKTEPITPAPGLTNTAEPAVKPAATPGANANTNVPPSNVPASENKLPLITGAPIPAPEVKNPVNTDPKDSQLHGPPPAPIGSNQPVTSPPIPAALAGGQTNNSLPQVKQYDINTYLVQPVDRSFADISQKVYGSEKYGQALVLFNRDHPQATEGIRQEPPQLRPGSPIFYPPRDVLESKYASAIGTPAGPGRTNSSPVTVGVPTPVPAPTPGNPNNVAAPPPGTWAGPGDGKTYRVGNNGEPIYKIAQNVLGDGTRWFEIYRLNPTLNPQFPIPAGTELKLP